MRRLLLVLALPSLALLARCGCAPPPPVDECQLDEECAAGTSCLVDDAGAFVCSVRCGVEQPCPSGQACVQSDEDGYLCLRVQGNLALGEPCQGDAECSSGACVGEDANSSFCVELCVDDGDCREGERCYVVEQRKVCLEPLAARAAGESCQTPRQCESARCVEVEPDAGSICLDGCAPEEGCEGPRNCVQLTSGAHVCVDHVPDGTPCTTALICERGRCAVDEDGDAICTGPCGEERSCAAGWACVDDTEGSPICMPVLEDAKAAGESCAQGRECQSGLCVHYATDEQDYGTLCSDPCLADGSCADESLVCWELDDRADVCGPFPA